MDRMERVLLRIAIGVVVALVVRELTTSPVKQSRGTNSGSMVMAW